MRHQKTSGPRGPPSDCCSTIDPGLTICAPANTRRLSDMSPRSLTGYPNYVQTLNCSTRNAAISLFLRRLCTHILPACAARPVQRYLRWPLSKHQRVGTAANFSPATKQLEASAPSRSPLRVVVCMQSADCAAQVQLPGANATLCQTLMP
jgi:hypothetical protein